MDGFPPYAKVTSIAGNTANISKPATSTGTTVAVSFLGNQITGISPNLPILADLNEFTLTSLTRSSNVVTGTTSGTHSYLVGESVIISGSTGINILSTTGNTTNNSNQLTFLASVVGIAPDQLIAGTGIPVGTKVVSILGNTVTMSNNATATNASIAVIFSENLNGGFKITGVGSNTFTYSLIGTNGTASTAGVSRVERVGLSNSGSKIFVNNAVSNAVSRITGSYLWDLAAPFVLASDLAECQTEIQAGKIVRLLDISDNTISSSGGFVMFDYGLNTQEGPVRYLYKPTNTTIAIDPSYVFKYNHDVGSSIVALRTKGAHVMSNNGDEYAPYVTDPSEARIILEELIRSVKSAGIFVNFLIRYPEQLYGILDVYNQQGVGAGAPFES
jgi:hypothetical protein